VVPHFEKMLYDNALLLRVYTHWWRSTGSPLARRVALDTADWMMRDLRTPEGGFASALDADTDGVEGLTYVWTPEQLRSVLGAQDGDWAADLLVVTPAGTFEDGASTLQLPGDPDDPARWARVRAALLAAREARPQPARDDKVVAAWNGLAVAALAETGLLLDRPDLVAASAAAADLVVSVHLADGRLRRVSREGVAGRPAGVLEDYADLAEGLLALYAVTGDSRRLTAAGELLEVVLSRFPDAGVASSTPPRTPPTRSSLRCGACRTRPTTRHRRDSPPRRARCSATPPTPAPSVTGRQPRRPWRSRRSWPPATPGSRVGGLAVAEALADGPREVAVLGPENDPATAALHGWRCPPARRGRSSRWATPRRT
jgi:hypothetical protein